MQPSPSRSAFVEHFGPLGAGMVVAPFLCDGLTPVGALLRLGPSPLGRFLLESAEQGGHAGRFSFVGTASAGLVAFEPGLGHLYRAHPRDGLVYEADRWESRDPVGELRDRLAGWRLPEAVIEAALAGTAFATAERPPFLGGAVGFLGYDVVRSLERLGPGRPSTVDTWIAAYMLADAVVVFDHLTRVGYAVAIARWSAGQDPGAAYDEALVRLEVLWERLHGDEGAESLRALVDALDVPAGTSGAVGEPVDESFEEAVRTARRYIQAGDIFQVVLSRELVAPCPTPPLHVYRRLRAINPSPYMFFLEVADPRPRGRPLHLVGASPEVMVRLQRGRAVVRPIAGTRPRGGTPEQDRRLAQELKDDPKELAEHMMLVDLGRNDLGRVCRYGTVRVSQLLEIERYSHVMHLVSEVEGRLAPGLDAFDLVKATFPAGTVTGAPKVRAMQIIDELEATGRGPYAGAVGYFSVTGDADACITIRTLAIHANRAHARAGAGIVADSQPRRELWETHNKASAMLVALGLERVEVA